MNSAYEALIAEGITDYCNQVCGLGNCSSQRGPLCQYGIDSMTHMPPQRPHGHVYHDREDGLAHCKVCHGAEGSLPTQCPQRKMSDAEEDAVYAAQLDYRDNHWQVLSHKL